MKEGATSHAGELNFSQGPADLRPLGGSILAYVPGTWVVNFEVGRFPSQHASEIVSNQNFGGISSVSFRVV